MAKKDFVMISTSLLECRRFRSLQNCCERNAYFTACLSSRANYIGIFHYPLWLFAQESKISEGEMLALIQQLTDVGLIDYDPQHEFIRLREWFYSSNISTSDTTVMRAAADYLERAVPRNSFVAKSIAEFIVGSLLGVHSYSKDSKHGPVVTEELRKFLVAATPLYPDLEALIVDEIRHNGTSVQRAFEDLFLGIVEGEVNAERLALWGSQKGISGGQEGATRHVTKTLQNKNENKFKQDDDQIAKAAQRRGPLPETVASAIAKGALSRGGHR